MLRTAHYSVTVFKDDNNNWRWTLNRSVDGHTDCLTNGVDATYEKALRFGHLALEKYTEGMPIVNHHEAKAVSIEVR